MSRRIGALTVPECGELLENHHFGRLALIDAVGVLPLLIPVNYLLDGDTLVFRTDAGSKLRAAARGAPVTFEVDDVDQDRRIGWSVVVRGHAEEVTDPIKLAELQQTPLVAWAPGAKPHYVRVRASQVIGNASRLPTCPRTGGDERQERRGHLLSRRRGRAARDRRAWPARSHVSTITSCNRLLHLADARGSMTLCSGQ